MPDTDKEGSTIYKTDMSPHASLHASSCSLPSHHISFPSALSFTRALDSSLSMLRTLHPTFMWLASLGLQSQVGNHLLGEASGSPCYSLSHHIPQLHK